MMSITLLGLWATAAVGQDNLDYWLNQATTATAPAEAKPPKPEKSDATATAQSAPADETSRRPDALPGAIEMSDGKILWGFMHTTADKDWELYLEDEKLLHRVPFIAVLSIRAQVVEEKLDLEWRWKEMGTPERVYTGQSYPTRRLLWTIKLIDGTSLTGAIKGQPLWIATESKINGPMILAERTKGQMGQKLDDLVYVKTVIVSRRLLDQLQAGKE